MPCINISGELASLLHHTEVNYMRRMIADEAKLGNIVSTEVGWIIAQEELNVCDD